ncbi:masp6.3 like protein [Malacosoma neustria nucleopolyhedrovirus]|uniref:masp6.3 like protein n=1 Tax=Malacosoma neustria nuclear polyhedrosis virus TaxID=38012 RepID=UPI000E35C059|nr:masp6.3 like protein [Malacosoma neustria nucleopolyhedrovirus]AUF81646.1 masp6.3 like protein [Malacosoma neustria nucleopolyhedrovirus]
MYTTNKFRNNLQYSNELSRDRYTKLLIDHNSMKTDLNILKSQMADVCRQAIGTDNQLCSSINEGGGVAAASAADFNVYKKTVDTVNTL